MSTIQKVLILGAEEALGSGLLGILCREASLELYATVSNSKTLRVCEERYPHVKWRLFDVGPTCYVELNIETLPICDWYVNMIELDKSRIRENYPDDKERALAINAVFPNALDRFVSRVGGHIIQLGTPEVFSNSQSLRDEKAPHAPGSIYAQTRSLGEARSATTSVLRTSVLGPGTKGLLGLIETLRQLPFGSEVAASEELPWNGVTSFHLAKIIHAIIVHRPELKEVHHLIPADSCTQLQLVTSLVTLLKREDIRINVTKASENFSWLLHTADPGYNYLLWSLAGYPQGAPTIRQMLEELISRQEEEWLAPHSAAFSPYQADSSNLVTPLR